MHDKVEHVIQQYKIYVIYNVICIYIYIYIKYNIVTVCKGV